MASEIAVTNPGLDLLPGNRFPPNEVVDGKLVCRKRLLNGKLYP